MASRKRSISSGADVSAPYKEWDEISCPICMDHPHNAVLLICSSHNKGCRSYVCDTSYRHSNCLDRFKKLKEEEESADSLSATGLIPENHHDPINTLIENSHVTSSLVDPDPVNRTHEDMSNLKCPLCRGSVFGWQVLEDARQYLNLKPRSCSRESCAFIGNYKELRRHARRVHPTVRPADIDPSRQRAWHNLEDQSEYNDIVSAIQSAVPGAVVVGDYMIESGDRVLGERNRSGEGSRLLSTLFLFQMIGSLDRGAEMRGGRSRMLSRHRRGSGTFSRRRYLWGENLLGLQGDDDDEVDDDNEEDDVPYVNISSDVGDNGPPIPRRRRRLTRAESDEDHQ